MSATASPRVKDQESLPFGLIESAGVNSFADFGSSNMNKIKENVEKENNDFINLIMCHLIFYLVFCISLLLHILIDLGLSSFLKNIFVRLVKIVKNTVDEKRLAFA